MYSVREINKKGMGCIANQKIKRGTLIEKEKPVLEIPPGLKEKMLNNYVGFAQIVIDKFNKMEKNCKEDYLKLSNKLKMLDPNLPDIDEVHKDLPKWNTTYLKDFSVLNLGDIDVETAVEVYHIFETNAFHNGLFLKMSRFNHSCVSNAEHFWNDKENVREIRSISNIAEGEEIMVNYGGIEVLDTNERREKLSGFYFHCICPACDLSEEDLIKEKKSCQKMRELKEKCSMLNVQDEHDIFMYLNIRKEVECLKEMYQIAKKLKILRIKSLLQDIVEPGFDASCQGFYDMNKVYKGMTLANLPEKKKFYVDAQNFASVGMKLSLMLYGKENSETMDWLSRKADPIKFFEKEFVQ